MDLSTRIGIFLMVCALVVWLAPGILNAGQRRGRSVPLSPDPSIHVDLDILRQIESGGNCQAISKAGARGPYQLTRAAWLDARASLVARGKIPADSKTFEYDAWVHQETVAGCMAHEYVNRVLPRYLTCERLQADDLTKPMPDSLDARLAAYNAGAAVVRQAYAKHRANWPAFLPAETREYLSRYHRAEKGGAILLEQLKTGGGRS